MRGVILRLEDFKRHFYIIGGSRQGKTNLLATIAYYLASPSNQKLFPCGLIIIDPHGDLGFQLPMMLKNWENLRVIDPWYVRFGMNPLQLMPYNTSDEKSIQIQDQISQLILILEDILKTDTARATRMTWIFRGTLHYLYHFSDDITFLDLYNLMHDMMVMDTDELKEMLRDADIEDDVINKTLEAIITLPEEAFTPVMNRIFNFVVHEGSMASRIFCSRRSTLDWDWMMQPGHVTVVRMEAFNIPGDFRALFTNSFVLKLYFLIQHRAKELERQGRDPSERTPLYLMIDEFQTIEKLEALERILSESAKYGLLLGLAHQNMAQLSRRELLQSILTNVGLIVSFKVSSDDAAVLAKVFGEEWKTVLCEKLRRFEVVTKRTLNDGSSEVVRSTTSLAPPAVHTAEELKEFMKTKMNEMYGQTREDRKPVYMDEQQKRLKENRRPWVGPRLYVPMAYLLWAEGKEEYRSTLSCMEAVFFGRCGWAKTTVENSLRELGDLHYLSKTETMGYVIDGKDGQGNFVWRKPHPESKDEMIRARTDLYALTEFGRERYFPKPVPKSQRAGGRFHRMMMEMLIADYRRDGYWVEADWGDRHAKRPDLVVFKPKLRTFTDAATKIVKQIWDTEVWDYSGRTAVEIETNPRKNRKQVRLNYDKSAKARHAVVDFRVPYLHQVDDIKKILFDKEEGTYGVGVVQTGLSLDDLKRMLEEDDKVPPEGWVQLAPGDGVDVTMPEEEEPVATLTDGSKPPEDIAGPLGDLPKEAYERLTVEFWPYYQDHGRPAINSAYVKSLLMNPDWRDDPIWKAAEEKEAGKQQLEERVTRNIPPAQPRGEEGRKSPQQPQGGEARGEADDQGSAASAGHASTGAGNEAQSGKRPVPLREAIVEIIRDLQDADHRLEGGGYRVPFTELWERLRDRYGGPSGSDGFVGPNGKVVTATTVGRIVREGTSGKRVVWREGGKTVRGYLLKEERPAEEGSNTTTGPR
ncbi:MAG: type IV secretory system conjugative DNA transfer family protein [Nitrososphaerales archaeon]